MALPLKAEQWGDWTYASDGSNVTITGYTGSNLDVSIPDTISNMSVVAVGDFAFSNKTSLTAVSFPGTLSTIGAWAFLNCFSLKSVTIPPNVTNVGAYAFINCSGLTSLVLSNGITSLQDFSFFTCYSLTNITIPSSISFIGTGVFGNNTSLQTIDVSPSNQFFSSTNDMLFDKSQTTLIQCPASKKSGLSIPLSVVNVGDFSFGGCFSLTNMVIPDGVTNIGQYAFYSCSSLTNMVVPASVVNVGSNAFSWATRMTNILFKGSPPTIALPIFDWDNNLTVYYYPWTTGWSGTFGGRPTVPMDVLYTVNNGAVTITGYTGTNSFLSIPNTISNMPVVAIGASAFSNQASLTSIKIPDSVTTIGMRAFDFCSNLTNVLIGSGASVIYQPNFANCPQLIALDVNENNPAFCSMDGVVFSKDRSWLLQCPEGKAGNYTIPVSVATISITAFLNCASLTTVTVPANVTNIYWEAFMSCSNLAGIYFKGDTPHLGDSVFDGDSLTNYFYPWTSGWTNTFGGRPTQINPAYTQWLTNYGFTTSLTNDYDNDGMLNWQEYLAGTSPTNKTDALVITSMGGTNDAQFSWLAKSNVSYQIRKSLDLMGAWLNAPTGTGTNQQAFQTAPMDGLMQYADPDYAGSTNGFYRVNVVP
ncbi:MAG: leucine-rich repeat domain-containing protein [bacterium]